MFSNNPLHFFNDYNRSKSPQPRIPHPGPIPAFSILDLAACIEEADNNPNPWCTPHKKKRKHSKENRDSSLSLLPLKDKVQNLKAKRELSFDGLKDQNNQNGKQRLSAQPSPLQPLVASPVLTEAPPSSSGKNKSKYVKETLTQKLTKYLNEEKEVLVSTPLPKNLSPYLDCSQKVILGKINLYRDSLNLKRISEEGHCHGFTLLWLTLMSWDLEDLFYKMIQTIAACPNKELGSIGELITRFHDLIDLGQDPMSHSENTCGQREVKQIIGGETVIILKTTNSYYRNKLEKQLRNLRVNGNMIAVQGWHPYKLSDDSYAKVLMPKTTGHSVGVFVRDDIYHYYDSNFATPASLKIHSEKDLINRIRNSAYKNVGVTAPRKPLFSLISVKENNPPKTEAGSSSVFFKAKVSKEEDEPLDLTCHETLEF